MNVLSFDDHSLQEALSLLHGGGIVAHATETCYGLACDLTNPKAVDRLFAIKSRPANQPVSALFVSIEEAKHYVEWNERAEELAQGYLPGPLTLILWLKPDAPRPLYSCPPQGFERGVSSFELHTGISQAHSSTLGIRLSSHPHAGRLVEACGGPLSTTSANIHGQPNPYSVEDILAQFADAEFVPDLVLDSGSLPNIPPSTVMDLTKEGDVKRQGALKL